ncbi:MAG: tetratricopeptide repeat protein [bacterium]
MLFLAFLSFLVPFPFVNAQESKPPGAASTTPKKPDYDDYGYYKKYGRTGKAWNDFVKNGFEAYDSQDCEKTIANLKQAIGAGCNDSLVYFKLGACSELTGSYYSAIQYYKQSEDGLKTLSAPHRYQKDFYEAYGRALYMSKKLDEAMPYLIKAGEVGAPSYALYFLLGQIYLSKGDNPNALNYFNKAIAQPLDMANPAQLGIIYGSIGKAYLEAKDIEKAIQYLDMALKQTPTDNDIQQARIRAGDMKRQQEIFKMMQGLSNDSSKPVYPVSH